MSDGALLGRYRREVLRAAGIEHVIVLDLDEAGVRANWQEFHDLLERCIARGDRAIVVNLQAVRKVDSICDGSQLT
jgi:anti-anti-sigma regulatory factor